MPVARHTHGRDGRATALSGFALALALGERVALHPMFPTHLQSRPTMMRLLNVLVVFAALVVGSSHAQESESMAERGLKQLLEQQQALMAEAAKDTPGFDEEAFAQQMEQVCRGYETLLRANPNFAQGYAAYGYLLSKLDQRKHAISMLLKANQLDPNQPLVKNQIGNYLAEEGKPLDALQYYLSAIKLAPKEPLYHYQLGTLLHEARDDFLTSGEWQADAIGRAIHEAFRQAAELAPDRIEFTYRYAESFYEMDPPDWDGALKAWGQLEEKAPTPIERETMRLHAANVLIKQGKPDHARALLETVQEEALQTQRQKLLDQLAKPAES